MNQIHSLIENLLDLPENLGLFNELSFRVPNEKDDDFDILTISYGYGNRSKPTQWIISFKGFCEFGESIKEAYENLRVELNKNKIYQLL